MVEHQAGAFAGASPGGQFVKAGMGYAPLWIINQILATIATIAGYCIKEDKSIQ